jgi:hypothetical protein
MRQNEILPNQEIPEETSFFLLNLERLFKLSLGERGVLEENFP